MMLQGLSSQSFSLPPARSIRRLSSLTKSPAPDANADLHALKAVISYKLKDTASAIREAQAALKIAPDNVSALAVLAADRLANNDPKGALQLLSGEFYRSGQGSRRAAVKNQSI